MYNSKFILAGLVVFLALFTSPFWLNALTPEYKRPDIVLPKGADGEMCVAPLEYMRAEHMTLLNTWRDMALREGLREYVDSRGNKWEINLQNTCMSCHANKKDFCDTCHDSNGVDPYCWDCHVEPKGN